MLPFQDSWVHYNNQHWVLECLTENLLTRNAQLIKDAEAARTSVVSMYRKLKDLKAKIANLSCSRCGNKVNKNYLFLADVLICHNCCYDHGGES
jgi:hypothetical protein